MRFSENWLRTLVDPPLCSDALGDAVTMAGIEVEAIDPVAPAFDQVVVGEVLDVKKHPHADRLTVCSVNPGGAPIQVVCGAPNVRPGIRVPLAKVGAKLPGGEIKSAAVRGIESSGMLCSAQELGLSEDAAGLLILEDDAPVGRDIREYLALDDRVLTIKPTPNRGDCLSVSGIAREIAAITGSSLTPVIVSSVRATLADAIDIDLVDKSACPLYCGRIVRGIDAHAPTPRWIAQRLERSGLRSISAVVDVTNYVMLELGQPMHAFDLACIQGGIQVRAGRSGEKLKLLNGEQIDIGADFLVIADHAKPLALAGIMGGEESAVTAATRDVLLESAFFDPSAIAGKSRMLGFGSDSSYRFERGVDFSVTARALERATQLVLEMCGGKAGPVCEAKAVLPERNAVMLRAARVRRLLGVELANEAIALLLRRSGFSFVDNEDHFSITPSPHRFDLTIEEDFIEEVARMHGYNNINAAAPVGRLTMLPAPERDSAAHRMRQLLVARDYQETITYSFVDKQWEVDFCANVDPVMLANPIAAQMNAMRSSMLGSLVDCLRLNLSRQQSRVRLFEIGRCFRRIAGGAYSEWSELGGLAYGNAVPEQWASAKRPADFYDVKGDLEALLGGAAAFVAWQHPALHPGRTAQIRIGDQAVGWLGQLHPRLQRIYDLPAAPMAFSINIQLLAKNAGTTFEPFSNQPIIRRDIAVEIAENIPYASVLASLKRQAPASVKHIALFDVYRGKGIDSDKKSVAFRVLLQDTHKTLTDAEAEAAIARLIKVLQEEFDAKLRR